jgi:hypothetical protein
LPSLTNTTSNKTSPQISASERLDLQAPETGFTGDLITIKLVIAGTDTPVPSANIEVITPTHERLTLLTNQMGEASYTADEVGIYQYILLGPNLLVKNRVTNIFERVAEKVQPSTQNNVTVQPAAVPASIAQVLSANAPLCAGFVVLLAILLFALAKRRKKKEEKKK